MKRDTFVIAGVIAVAISFGAVGNIDAATLIDAPAYIENGRVMIPLRALCNWWGGITLSYEPSTQRVTLREEGGHKTIHLWIGQSKFYVTETLVAPPSAKYLKTYEDSKQGKLDAAPITKEGRTFVPLRFVAEALGASVKWISGDSKVRITKPYTREERPRPWLGTKEASRTIEEYWAKHQAEIIVKRGKGLWIGATMEEVIARMGKPHRKQTMHSASGHTEYWYYGRSQICFDDGRVTAINKY